MHDYNTILGVIELRLSKVSYDTVQKRYRIGRSGIALIMNRYNDSGLSLDDLRQMKMGDLFAVHTLNEELVYEVESISVVLPEEVDSLAIVPGRDLCTLITCTPYGVNDHRLLVTGHRTDKQLERSSVGQEALAYATNMRVLPFILGLLLAIASVAIYARSRRRKKTM